MAQPKHGTAAKMLKALRDHATTKPTCQECGKSVGGGTHCPKCANRPAYLHHKPEPETEQQRAAKTAASKAASQNLGAHASRLSARAGRLGL